MEERDDYPIIPQEPIFIPAGDRRVLLNGQPPYVPCRVVAEERYQLMEKELASLKEVIKELIPIAERMQSALESGESICYDNVYDLADAQRCFEIIERAKRFSDNK